MVVVTIFCIYLKYIKLYLNILLSVKIRLINLINTKSIKI